MKKLILVFVMWPMMVSVFGQNPAEKYNGYGFPVRSSHCERNNQEESKPFESGCSFKNITDDGDYFVVGCFGTEEYSES